MALDSAHDPRVGAAVTGDARSVITPLKTPAGVRAARVGGVSERRQNAPKDDNG